MHARSQTIKKDIVKDMQKENLLLAHYSHFKSALEEAKNVPRIFSAYFENKMRQDKRTSSKCCHNI